MTKKKDGTLGTLVCVSCWEASHQEPTGRPLTHGTCRICERNYRRDAIFYAAAEEVAQIRVQLHLQKPPKTPKAKGLTVEKTPLVVRTSLRVTKQELIRILRPHADCLPEDEEEILVTLTPNHGIYLLSLSWEGDVIHKISAKAKRENDE